MPPSIKAKIWWNEEIQAYCITTPFDNNFIAALKALVPASERLPYYEEQFKWWTFTEPYLGAIETLARQCWRNASDVVVVTKAQAQANTTKQANNALSPSQGKAEASFAFLRAIGFEAAQSSYRAACKQFHPDVCKDGGERMSSVNALWGRLKKEVFGK